MISIAPRAGVKRSTADLFIVIATKRARTRAAARAGGGLHAWHGGLVNRSTLLARWRSWAPYLLSVSRIVAAFLFGQVGTAKLLAFPAAIMPGGSHAT